MYKPLETDNAAITARVNNSCMGSVLRMSRTRFHFEVAFVFLDGGTFQSSHGAFRGLVHGAAFRGGQFGEVVSTAGTAHSTGFAPFGGKGA